MKISSDRFFVIFLLFVVIPLAALLPLYYQVPYMNKEVIGPLLLSYSIGYPSATFLFYTSRSVWSVLPAPIRALKYILLSHLLLFVVVPFGIFLPLYESRKYFFASDVNLYLTTIVYSLPISFLALWTTSLFLNLQHVWRWCLSLRCHPLLLREIAKRIVQLGCGCLLVPLPTSLYALLLLGSWEEKNQDALEGYVVVVTCLSFLLVFVLVFSMVSLQWLGHLERTNGIESLLPITSSLLLVTTASWGSTILNQWIGLADPQILVRIDQDDYVLLVFVEYSCLFYVLLSLCSYLLYKRIKLSMHYLKRFGRHPEDWEKGSAGDPSLLTRDLTEQQQAIVQVRFIYLFFTNN